MSFPDNIIKTAVERYLKRPFILEDCKRISIESSHYNHISKLKYNGVLLVRAVTEFKNEPSEVSITTTFIFEI